MEETTIHTLLFKGRHFVIDEAKAAEYQPENVKAWVFQHKPYTIDNLIASGRTMSEAGTIFDSRFTDAETLAATRAKALAQSVLTGWNRKSDDGAEIPVTPENIGTLPPQILRTLVQRIERGVVPTDEELEALKRPTRTSASTG